LGELVLAALSLNDNPLVIASSVMAMVLALIADFTIGQLEKWFSKKGRVEKQQI